MDSPKKGNTRSIHSTNYRGSSFFYNHKKERQLFLLDLISFSFLSVNFSAEKNVLIAFSRKILLLFWAYEERIVSIRNRSGDGVAGGLVVSGDSGTASKGEAFGAGGATYSFEEGGVCSEVEGNRGMSSSLYNTLLSAYPRWTEQERRNAAFEVSQQVLLLGLCQGGFFDEAAFYGGTCLRIFQRIGFKSIRKETCRRVEFGLIG